MILTRPGLAQKLAVAASLLALAPALEAQPAGNGQMGPTSHASARISVSVRPRFEPQLHELAEAQDAAVRPRGPTQRFCISSNAQAGSFSVTAFDASPGVDRPRRAASHGQASPVEPEGPDARPAASVAAGLLNGSFDTVPSCTTQRSPADAVLGQARGSNHGSFGPQARTVLLLIAPD